jgi:hypothetical protein
MMLDKDDKRYGYDEGGSSTFAYKEMSMGKLPEQSLLLSKKRTEAIQDRFKKEFRNRMMETVIDYKSRKMKEQAQKAFDELANKPRLTISEALKLENFTEREPKAVGGSLLADDMAMMQEEEEMPTHTMPDGTVMPGATHEEGEMMMEESEEMDMEPETPMESDSEMEDNYLDFIIDEALSEEEEDMLMSKLEQDEELSMLFDKVIEVASEFAGSGPVEGPGTGVSDSIPARLSDGEFVFTAKAVEEIGADNLMAMMKEAEMKADERQGMANGGTMEEEEDQPEPVVVAEQAPVRQDIRVTKQTVGPQASVQEERDLIDEEIKKGMLSSRPYVRS